jgi:phosphopantothenoylcysteine decarboxylase/phosphopantothenate--cysteine ligase
MTPRPRAARRPFAGRRVVLGVTGGIAAYKAVQLARDLTLAGAEVDVVLTRSAAEFVGPLSFEALTGRAVHGEMHRAGEPLLHIRLAREADLVLIAPATADLLARAAAGRADDLLAAVLLATSAPVLLCPGMNDRMYGHPQTTANLRRLGEIGYRVAGPGVGPLAWGEGEGPGRLLDPAEILEHAGRALEGTGPLTDRRVLVTAGPTREPLDPVRYLGNRSSGRMGYSLAASAWRRGARVTLGSGPVSLAPPAGVQVVRVETAAEMRDAVAAALPSADLLVMAAAVADFRPPRPAGSKLKKERGGVPGLELEPTTDVLRDTLPLRPSHCVVVGFALETDDPLENARAKLESKRLDLLVLNDAREPGAGFEVGTNRVTILRPDREPEPHPLLPKDDVADELLDRAEALLPPRGSE